MRASGFADELKPFLQLGVAVGHGFDHGSHWHAHILDRAVTYFFRAAMVRCTFLDTSASVSGRLGLQKLGMACFPQGRSGIRR